jgi:hypothetical protein
MIKKLKLVFVTSALLIGGVAGSAAAKNHGGHGKKAMVQKFDANGDGQLDAAERLQLRQAFKAKRAQHKAARLAKFDANRNGALDPGERQAMKSERALRRFQALDANGDGKLTLDEFQAGRLKHRGMKHRGMHRRR